MKDKHDEINSQFEQITDRINKKEKDQQIYSMRHRELENLKFQDQNENAQTMKKQRFRQNSLIDEKHITLGFLNNDRKQFMDSYNDKYRAKLAKDRLVMSENNGPEPIFQQVKNLNLNLVTYAPDLVPRK